MTVNSKVEFIFTNLFLFIFFIIISFFPIKFFIMDGIAKGVKYYNSNGEQKI